jgi:hypothetical protein
MIARNSSLLCRALTALCIVAACGDGTSQPSTPTAAKADAAPTTATPPADSPPVTATPGASKPAANAGPTPAKIDTPEKTDAPLPADGKIGVAECDEYIEKYRKCIMERMPDKAQGYMNEAIEQSAKAWRDAAAGPSKDGVAAVCKVALDAAKQATTSLGCQW